MMDIKNKLSNIQENILLANHTTFKIGGPARYFFIAENTEEIKKAVSAAKKLNINYFILGSGSNVLVSDKGFNGLIIKILNSKFHARNASRSDAGGQILNSKIIYVNAGVSLKRIVQFSIDKGLTGLEWAVGIPGTIGGAIRGNAGAFGKSISDAVIEVKVLNCNWKNNQEIKKYSSKDCGFNYRDSIFKHDKNLIILSAKIQLNKKNKEKSRQMISGYLKQRKENQPLEYPSAGSIFKNQKLQGEYPELKKFSKYGMIPIGLLIEECGLAGKKINGAMVSEKHCNFIVNVNSAKAKDVVELINLIKKTMKNKFGIQIREEIEYVGF